MQGAHSGQFPARQISELSAFSLDMCTPCPIPAGSLPRKPGVSHLTREQEGTGSEGARPGPRACCGQWAGFGWWAGPSGTARPSRALCGRSRVAAGRSEPRRDAPGFTPGGERLQVQDTKGRPELRAGSERRCLWRSGASASPLASSWSWPGLFPTLPFAELSTPAWRFLYCGAEGGGGP